MKILTMKILLVIFLAISCVNCLEGQRLDGAKLLQPATDTWPSYNGDYSGRRYSTLSQINSGNVASLTLAWAFQTHQAALKSTPLEVNGILYFTVTDHVWAVDARTGRQIWHFNRPSAGDKIGNRGVAMHHDRIYFGTADAHLVCLDARNGHELWEVEVADVKFGYYISAPPLVVKDKLIVGISGDQADIPGFLDARDPESGKLIWRWYSLPKPGEPGSESWPNANKMSHGGGTTWMPGTYDPELNLIYWGIGNPHPVLDGSGRPGSNLYTCSIVAINPDSGKMVWYFQASPHDTDDRDANETPVLFDANFRGKPRKLLAQASRNGIFFLLDRRTGEDLLHKPYGGENWLLGFNSRGEPIPDPKQERTPDGVFFEITGTSWWAPSYDPTTGLLYVNGYHDFSVEYLTAHEDDQEDDHQGGTRSLIWSQSYLWAIDYSSGQIRWKRESESLGYFGSGNGILTTAGKLLFTNQGYHLIALDPATGTILWSTNPGGVMSGCPMTYELDGRQYVLMPVDGVLYAWALPGK